MNEPVLIKGTADPVNNTIYVKARSGHESASARISVAPEEANTFEMHAPYDLREANSTVAFTRLHVADDGDRTLVEPETELRIAVPPGCHLDTFLGNRIEVWPCAPDKAVTVP